MRYKIKALLGFYQCVAAVPSVYNVQPPLGLEEYTRSGVRRGVAEGSQTVKKDHLR
jgi:hypothetical protein